MDSALNSLLTILLSILVLMLFIVFLFGPGQTMQKGKALFFGVFKTLGIYHPDAYSETLKASEKLTNSFNDFYKKIKKTSDDEKCFILYNKFENMGKSEVHAVTHENKLTLSLRAAAGLMDVQVIEKMKLSVLAGSNQKTQAFIDYWITGKATIPTCTEVNSLIWHDPYEISYDGEVSSKKSGNKDHGILYKPSKDSICIIPTHDSFFGGCDAKENSINSKCFESIFSAIESNKIRQCEEK